jgi:hypothetical protein
MKTNTITCSGKRWGFPIYTKHLVMSCLLKKFKKLYIFFLEKRQALLLTGSNLKQESTREHRKAQEITGKQRRAQERTGENRNAQERTGEQRNAQESKGEHRREQESTGENRRAQNSTGEHRREQESAK